MKNLLSRREKLLLGLLGSAMLFSFSFSYGAVNQAKVDSIMQTITSAANNFSSQADRDTYYQRVYTGLSDAIDMLAVVRNNVGAMIGTAPVTVPPVTPPPVGTPPVTPPIPPTGGANPLPVTVANPIADYPIPPPCPAGVKIQKELMGKVTGAWKSTAFDRAAYPPGLIFKFRIDTVADMKAIGMITVDGEAAASRGHTVVRARLSPYPCDFPTAETWLQSPNDVNTDVCANVGGNIQYGVNTTGFKRLSKSTAGGGACNLKIGETYYLNIQATPSIAQHDEHHIGVPGVHTDCNRSDMACALLMEDKGLDATPTRPQYWGIYNTFEEYAATRLIQNNSSENPETLRQKVINDYKIKGMNTDGTTAAASTPATSSPAATSTVPFANNCPAGVQLSGGWDIRNPKFGVATSLGNLLTATIGKPIVVAINVPSGYTTSGITKPPGAALGQAQIAFSQGETAISVSTSACTAANPAEFLFEDAGVKLFVTEDDPRSNMGGLYYKIIPGQINYITIWERGTTSVPNAGGKWGLVIDFTNWKRDLGGSADYNIPRQLADASGKFPPFSPGMPTAFPTSSNPLSPSIGTSSSSSTPTPAASTRVGPWENMENIFCPDTLANAQKSYPNANGYWWTNVVPNSNGQTSNSWWNVKDKNKLTDESLPATCTTGKEFIKHTTSYHCDRYVCRN